MCYRSSAKLTHIMRQMLPEDLDEPMEKAAAQQHDVLRRMFHISRDQLPNDLAPAAAHPSATVYRLHLTTDLGGCAIPHPQLLYLIAHLGGAASTFNSLHRSGIIGHLFVDPTTWATSKVRHLRRAAESFNDLISLPAFHTPPAMHPERYQSFVSALTGSDGKPTIANIGELEKHHPQSNFTKIFNRQLFDDLTSDESIPELDRAVMHAAATFNAGRCLVPLTGVGGYPVMPVWSTNADCKEGLPDPVMPVWSTNADCKEGLPEVTAKQLKAGPHNSELCSCGQGRRGLWPWMVQTAGLGYYRFTHIKNEQEPHRGHALTLRHSKLNRLIIGSFETRIGTSQKPPGLIPSPRPSLVLVFPSVSILVRAKFRL